MFAEIAAPGGALAQKRSGVKWASLYIGAYRASRGERASKFLHTFKKRTDCVRDQPSADDEVSKSKLFRAF